MSAGSLLFQKISKPKLLWENPNPDSNWTTTPISVNTEGYDAIIYQHHTFGSTNADYGIISFVFPVDWWMSVIETGGGIPIIDEKTGPVKIAHLWSSNSNNRNGARRLEIMHNQIGVSACTFNGTTQNGYAIPYKIYGIKFE